MYFVGQWIIVSRHAVCYPSEKPGMKRLYWVADHLKPPPAFERLVGKQWSLLVLADFLEIVPYKVNERRERVRQGAMEW